MTRHEYRKEIESLASAIESEVRESIDYDNTIDVNDAVYEAVHLTVDSHMWIIYNAYHLDIIQHSDNAEYGIDEGLIDATSCVAEGGVPKLHQVMAFWAMYEDVRDALDVSELEEYAATVGAPVWTVIVGNIGEVCCTTDEDEARRDFDYYREQSADNSGRAAGETVTLLEAGEIIEEYIPAETAEDTDTETAL
jgi:hypothetical protein